jgi:hypothetical protein
VNLVSDHRLEFDGSRRSVDPVNVSRRRMMSKIGISRRAPLDRDRHVPALFR